MNCFVITANEPEVAGASLVQQDLEEGECGSSLFFFEVLMPKGSSLPAKPEVARASLVWQDLEEGERVLSISLFRSWLLQISQSEFSVFLVLYCVHKSS